jgi:hypothetical protein
MLNFYSANVRIANGTRAVDECLEIAFGDAIPSDCRVVMVNAAMGHPLERLAPVLTGKLPGAVVLGNSCAGVIGKAGVGESLHDIALVAVSGPEEEVAYSSVDGMYGHNSYEKGLELANGLKGKVPGAKAVYLMCPGIDISAGLVLKAFNEVFGPEIVVFGGTSSDNMRAIANYQCVGSKVTEHGAWAVGFADPAIDGITRATHGFTAYGEAMVVTKSEGNKIIELDGKPAWDVFTSRLSLDSSAKCVNTIPIGALAEALPEVAAEEYGNSHILRAALKFDADGTIYYPVACPEGTRLWLTMRDEELIFSEQRRSLEHLKSVIKDRRPVAVFQTDCLARGRLLFNKVIKDELIAMLHSELSVDAEVPPWFGMYGFGEFARLGGKNEYHNYTTALLVLYR